MELIRKGSQFCRLYFRMLRRRPAEAGAFAFLMLASLIVYIHGTFFILPMVVIDHSQIVKIISAVAATWCFVAIWANMFLIHARNSSILGRELEQPLIVAADQKQINENGTYRFEGHSGDGEDIRERLIKEQTKAIGQQFLVTPFGNENAWHICGSCETYVPPRCWHCSTCNTCILRRDHHCVFTMCCIGLDNQVHFLGLLAYLAMGTAYATFLSISYCYHYLGIPYWLYCVKALVSVYTLLFDFSIVSILSSVTLVGGFAATGVFVYYLFLAMQGKTSSDQSRGIERALQGQPRYSYEMLRIFLGPKPILRILWPFASHPVIDLKVERNQNNQQTNFKRTDESSIEVI